MLVATEEVRELELLCAAVLGTTPPGEETDEMEPSDESDA